jgi:hypothetical protein
VGWRPSLPARLWSRTLASWFGSIFVERKPASTVDSSESREHVLAVASEVELPCVVCGTVARLSEDAAVLNYVRCDAPYVFRKCEHCGAIDQVGAQATRERILHCNFCARASSLGPKPSALTARERLRELEKFLVAGIDADVRHVGRFTHVGGNGFAITPGSVCSILTLPQAVVVTVALGERRPEPDVVIPYGELTGLELGSGARTTGGSFLAFGFDLEEAAESLLAASVINALTRRTKINTMLRIGCTRGEILLHHGKSTPDQIRIQLSPLFTRYAAVNTAVGPEHVTNDPLARLERLVKLPEVDAITEEEFQAARVRYARQLTDSE